MSLRLEDFEHYSPQEYLAFALYLSDSWIKRTVEKVELLSETEYLHKASFQINISNEFLSSSFEQLSDYSDYWAKTNEDKLTSQTIKSFKKRISKNINNFFKDGETKRVYLPLFTNIKDPLIELDLYREGSSNCLEVLNRDEGRQKTVALLDLFFKLNFDSAHISNNIRIINDLICCYPNHIERRISRLDSLDEFFFGELEGYISGNDINEITNILSEEETDKQLDRISEKIMTLQKDWNDKDIHLIIIAPLLLIRDDFKNYGSSLGDIKNWARTFLTCCEKYVDALHILAKNHPHAIDILESFLTRYILYIKTEIKLDLPFLVKYSSKKIEPKFIRRYIAGWKDAGAGILNLRKKEDNTLLTKIATLPLINVLKRLRIYLSNYFVAPIDLLGHGESYHFEFSTKDFEIDILTYALQYSRNDETVVADVNRFFGINKLESGYLHIYTSRKKFFDETGSEIQPAAFRLIIWPYIRLLSPLLFSAIALIELLSLYLMRSVVDFTQPNSFIGVGVISIVGTLSIRYSPGPILTCLLRTWRRIIVAGLLMNIFCVVGSITLQELAFDGRIWLFPMLTHFRNICFWGFLSWIFYELFLGRVAPFFRRRILKMLGHNLVGEENET